MTAGTRSAADAGATAEFERIYRANVDAVTAYFARRSADPHVVADLTADTFVGVITLRSPEGHRTGKMRRLAGRRELDQDQVEELLDRIDAERAGRDLVSELAALPERDRAVVELVDIAGLKPKEAATVSSGSTDRRWQTPDGRRRDPGPGAHRSTRCRRPPCDRGTIARSP